MKVNPVKDPEFRRQWSIEHDHCQVCWVSPRDLPFCWLETHHLARPGRSDEACNLLRLCKCCHDRRHVVYGEEELTDGVLLEVKRLAEPDDWDPARLAKLWFSARAKPEAITEMLEPIPEWVKTERTRR